MKFHYKFLARGAYWRGTRRAVLPLGCMLILLAAPTAQAAGVLQDLLSGLAAGTAASPAPAAPPPTASGPTALPMMTTKTPPAAGTIPLAPMDMTPMWSRQQGAAPANAQAAQAAPAPQTSQMTPAPQTAQITPAPQAGQTTPATQAAQATPAPQTTQMTPAPQAGQTTPLVAAAQTYSAGQGVVSTPATNVAQPTPAPQTSQIMPAPQATQTPAPQAAQATAAPQATQPTPTPQTTQSTPVPQAGQLTPPPPTPKAKAKSKTAAKAKAKAKAKNTPEPAPAAPLAPAVVQSAPAGEALSGPQAEAAAAYAAADYVKAHALWQNLAEKADPRAMYNLGVLYDKGQGVTEDPTLAAFWFLKSAEAGHAAGMSNLGRLLEQGRGLSRDQAQAALWFRKAADKGLAEAQYNLAVLYERGLGVEKSDREAAAWYSRAAAQNQTDAQGRLGQMYREGRGVSKNATRAVLLLYGASMDGNTEAIRALEQMAVDPALKGKAAPSRPSPAVLFGLPLEHTTRDAVRQTMAASKIPVVREDAGYICDVYDVRAAIPGATEMAACYGPGTPQALGFVKIDYPSPDKQQTEKVTGMLTTMLVDRFGPPAATEGQGAALWNLGTVIVAVQHSPATKETGLMYMVPRVYHLTRYKK